MHVGGDEGTVPSALDTDIGFYARKRNRQADGLQESSNANGKEERKCRKKNKSYRILVLGPFFPPLFPFSPSHLCPRSALSFAQMCPVNTLVNYSPGQ